MRSSHATLRRLPGLAFCLALVLAACAGAGEAADPETTPEEPPAAGQTQGTATDTPAEPAGEPVALRYSFDWSPDSDWAPVLWAEELGYFAEEGVEVEYVPGDPQLVQVLGAGEIDMAQMPGPQALLSYGEDLPFTAVGVQLPESPLVILADADAGIAEPKDLEGHKVAVQTGEFEGFVWEAWAAAHDIDRSQIEEVPAAGTADVLFIDHQVDAFMDFYTSGAMVELTDGREGEETLFLVGDTLDMIGQSQVVNNDYLTQNPEAVRGFLNAWARGAVYALEHPDETIDLVLEKFPELERPGVEWSFPRFSEFWQSEQFASEGILSFTPEMWDSTKQVLVDAELMDDVDISAFYTDEYLPEPPVLPPS